MLVEPYYSRLEHMIEVLERIPAQHFNLECIVYADERLVKYVGEYEAGELNVRDSLEAIVNGTPLFADCGTVACIAGWMPAAFPEDFKWSDAGRPTYNGLSALRAGPDYLGLNDDYFFPYWIYEKLSDEEDDRGDRVEYNGRDNVCKILRAVLDGQLDPDKGPGQEGAYAILTEGAT